VVILFICGAWGGGPGNRNKLAEEFIDEDGFGITFFVEFLPVPMGKSFEAGEVKKEGGGA